MTAEAAGCDTSKNMSAQITNHNMLRAAPQPISEVCLSIDVGSINAGICLFDGAPAAQQILWLERRQLLDEHAKVVHDYEAVKRHLDAIKYQVDTMLQGRPYWVLVEQQYFDSESKSGLVFNLQLESAVAMYFRAHQIDVRLIQATKRFPFLGIDGWAKDTRYQRKKRVVAKVKELLDPTVVGNRFGSRRHNLEGWTGLPDSSRHDMADAIAQCLHYYYRNLQAVREGTVVPPPAATAATNHGSQPPAAAAAAAAAAAGSNHRQQVQRPSKMAVRGKLERTLGQLDINYGNLLKGEHTASKKLWRVYQNHPRNPHLVTVFWKHSMITTDRQGAHITEEAALEGRLTPLLT